MKIVRNKQYQPLCAVAVVASALTLGVTAASAQQQMNLAQVSVSNSERDLGFFLNGSVGPSFMPNFNSDRLGPYSTFKTDPGVRFDFGPGWNFFSTPALTLGGNLETGILYNHLRQIDEGSSVFHGEFYQVPFLANIELKFHPTPYITPFIGFGGGGEFNEVRVHNPGAYDYYNNDYYYHDYQHDNQVDPAVQGTAGVRFWINSHTDLGVAYKFLAAFPSEGTAIESHSVLASLSFHF